MNAFLNSTLLHANLAQVKNGMKIKSSSPLKNVHKTDVTTSATGVGNANAVANGYSATNKGSSTTTSTYTKIKTNNSSAVVKQEKKDVSKSPSGKKGSSKITPSSSSGTTTTSRKSRKKRTKITEEQLVMLKKTYKENSIPDYGEREALAELTGLSIRVVQVWFQNRRAYLKRTAECELGTNNAAIIGIASGGKLGNSASCDVLNKQHRFGHDMLSGGHGAGGGVGMSVDGSPINVLGCSQIKGTLKTQSKLASLSSPMLSNGNSMSSSLPDITMLEKRVESSNHVSNIKNSHQNKKVTKVGSHNRGARNKRNNSTTNYPIDQNGVESGAQLCLSDYDSASIKRRYSSTTPQPICLGLKSESLQRSQSFTAEKFNNPSLYNLHVGSVNQDIEFETFSSKMLMQSDPLLNIEAVSAFVNIQNNNNRNTYPHQYQHQPNYNNNTTVSFNSMSPGSLSYSSSAGISRIQSTDTLHDSLLSLPISTPQSTATTHHQTLQQPPQYASPNSVVGMGMEASADVGSGNDIFAMDFDFNFNLSKNIGINIDNIANGAGNDFAMNNFLDELIMTDQ